MNTKRVLVLLIIAILLAVGPASSGFADEPAKMTNAAVIEMFEAGLSAEVIVTQIEQESSVDFDVETSSLIALRKLGIPSEVIAAMQRASQPSRPRQVSPRGHRAVTLIAGGERHRMYAAKMAGTKLTGGAWIPFAPTKIKTKIAGSRARLRIKDDTPVFEVSMATDLHPEDSIVLVRVKVKKDIRLITTSRVHGFGNTNLVPQKDRVPLGFDLIPAPSARRSHKQTFRAVVEKPLEPGEYVVVVGYRYFDFGISSRTDTSPD